MSTENIQPSNAPKPHPPVQRDAIHTVVNGLGVVRKLLFSAPVTHDGWQKTMLTHIGAAKQLGFTMFEIDAKMEKRPRRKQEKKQEPNPYGGIWSSFVIRIEGDEWKEPAAEEEAAPESPLVDTLVVYVYALAVE